MRQADATTSSTPPVGSRRALGFIFAVVFLDLLGTGVLLPIIPYLVRQFTPSGLAVGLLAVAFSAAQFLAAPFLGALSDRVGRRPVLVLSVLGSGAAYFLFGLATSLWVLFAARIIDGLTGGNITAAQAYIADVSRPEDRAKNFGLLGAAFGLGFIFGPAAGGALSHISLQVPAYAAGALSVLTAAFGFFALPESLPRERRRGGSIAAHEFDPLRALAAGFRRPELRTLLGAVFFLGFAMAGLRSNFAVYTLTRFHLGPKENAALFTFLGVVAAVMQGVVIRRLSGKVSERRLAVGGLALMTVGYMLIAYAPAVWVLYLAVACNAVGGGLAGPTLTGMISQSAPPAEQGAVLGASQSVQSLTQIVGPGYAGAVFDHVHYEAPYWSAAVCGLAAVALVELATRVSSPAGASSSARG
jgi:MFS family permease